VNLEGAKDITGAALPNTIITDKAGTSLPQRSNLLVTAGFTLPGFKGSLRGFRQYKPVADNTQLSGWKFNADGTRLWIACVPGETGCKSTDSNKRNLYTATGAGTIIAFTTANVATLAPLMNLSVTDATAVITAVRQLPIGPFVDSTPAIMNPPSLDPPPDDDYPNFAVANKGRRSIVWVGSNYGVLEAIDARLGVEVWGFIPMNLLPKLKLLREGQPITQFTYTMDGSAKIADVKIDGVWRTHLIMGEGPGGTFYQSFDVTMADMAAAVAATSDDIDLLLQYFSSPARVTFNWAFPRYTSFDPTIGATGDVSASATAAEKTVGQTWSDPAVGQVVDDSGPFTVLIGSGFLPYTTQQQTNRGGKIAGTTFYVLTAKDGALLASKDVGSDGLAETIDDCSSTLVSGDVKKGKKKKQYGCNQIKNALQSDPVATGPADSRYITKAYMGDLDGRVWRFDIDLDDSYNAKISATTKLFESGTDQPIFSSMATVNVGGSQQYVFYGTGSDLLPSTSINTTYHMLGVLDKGTSGLKTLDQKLAKTDTKSSDEKITAFPAVAGDIVFFTTTDFQPATACTAPIANLYAFTFIGGAAYDTTGDGKVSGSDTPLVKSITGARATAPFVVDQHLAFAAGNKVALFGNPTAYNNGIGQAGVRILSWREVR
jgi:Tfp pilus tip-associated adhesin PilY1